MHRWNSRGNDRGTSHSVSIKSPIYADLTILIYRMQCASWGTVGSKYSQTGPRSGLDLIACLRAGNEVLGYNNNIAKVASKRMRSGLASWRTILEEPGLLTIVNFSDSPSKADLNNLQPVLKDNDLHRSTNRYRTVIRRVLSFICKTLKSTVKLYHYLKNAQEEVTSILDNNVNNAASAGIGIGIKACSISLEATFNKSTYVQYIVSYDSEILVCVQPGDINTTRALLEAGMASIYDVDPYNLGLIYVRRASSYSKQLLIYLQYASYYYQRFHGAAKAMQMCTMLI